MKIIKTKTYLRDYKRKVQSKHLNKEMERIQNIEELILDSPNLKILILNPIRLIYGIEQKKGVLKEIYTANINGKIRLYMKPVGKYPYNIIEITEIEFLKIDDTHYGDG